MERKSLLNFVFISLIVLVSFFAGAFIQQPVARKLHKPQPEKMVALPVCEYELDNIRVIDGDTIEADILFPLGVTLRGEYIRFSDYDAWESSKRRRAVNVTDEEVVKGKQATAMLIKFLDDKTLVLELAEGARDNYGRVLGRGIVYAEDRTRTELIEFMTENNLLRKSSDEKEKKFPGGEAG